MPPARKQPDHEWQEFHAYCQSICFDSLKGFELLTLNEISNLNRQIHDLTAELGRQQHRHRIIQRLARGKDLGPFLRTIARKGFESSLPQAIDLLLMEKPAA